MIFYLGTHKPQWLGWMPVPLFVSVRMLRARKTLPLAVERWAMDSGGFTELLMFNGWQTPARQYATEARRISRSIGKMDWCSPQDWMCEPSMLAKTGLTIREHQERTIRSVQELRALEPSVPFAAVLQGWEWSDYRNHVDMYAKAGIDLTKEPIVGVGTMCRRQATLEAQGIMLKLSSLGIRLHGFGFKMQGLPLLQDFIVSSDSMAWSLQARRKPIRLEGHSHINCANCDAWALQWRGKLLDTLAESRKEV